MRSTGRWLGFSLLLVAVVLATLVTTQNHRPPPGTSSSEPVNRLDAFYSEYAEEGSCKWRQRIGAPEDSFPTLLRVALLAYPALLGAAVGFLVSLRSTPSGRLRVLSFLGLGATGLVLVWLIRLGFVRAALELC
jgi:hypothetical protein